MKILKIDNITMSCLKRKNTFTENYNKKTKIDDQVNEKKRKIDPYTHSNTKILKIDHTSIIEETILLIEYGMCSREMLNKCKCRYLNYIKNKEMIEFLNLMNTKNTIEDEMYLYRLVYKIEKSLLKNN